MAAVAAASVDDDDDDDDKDDTEDADAYDKDKDKGEKPLAEAGSETAAARRRRGWCADHQRQRRGKLGAAGPAPTRRRAPANGRDRMAAPPGLSLLPPLTPPPTAVKPDGMDGALSWDSLGKQVRHWQFACRSRIRSAASCS